MIIPDINLLIYAYDAGSPSHSKARDWWQECLSGAEPVGLLPVVVFGFIRIATSRRVFLAPMGLAEALGHVRSWMEQPPVVLQEPGPRHVEDVLRLLGELGTAGNLATDAQIAAVALEHKAVLHTADADFLRFPALRWFNPVTGAESARQSRERSS